MTEPWLNLAMADDQNEQITVGLQVRIMNNK